MAELENLHNLESTLIEIEYLLKSIERLKPDDGITDCLLILVLERLEIFKSGFYEQWHAQ